MIYLITALLIYAAFAYLAHKRVFLLSRRQQLILLTFVSIIYILIFIISYV